MGEAEISKEKPRPNASQILSLPKTSFKMSDDPWGTDANNNDDAWGGGGGFGDSGDSKPKSKGCFNCGQEGHMSRECTEPKKERKEGGGGGSGCRKCGEEGHFARECPKEGGDACRRCGEEGHFAKDCEKPMETRTIKKEDGTEAEIYVPKETEEGQLFDSAISSGINFDKFDSIEVKVSGENPPGPIKTFQDAPLRQLLKDNVEKSGCKKPTPIQKYAIPIIQGKRDLMGCAQTGSGKTAAFLLPILHNLMEDAADAHAGECPQKPQAIIVAPTRELCTQIYDEARKFASTSFLRICQVYVGTSTGFQLQNIFRGCNLLVCTVGRLMGFVDQGKISFEDVRFLVMDEADRMLDMGFAPEMTRIVSNANMPEKGVRQTLMFSATFPQEVQETANEFLNNHLFLTVGIVGGASSDVTQTVIEVAKFDKRAKLTEILADVGTSRTLVFVETKKNADFIACHLSQEGIPTTSIHGDRLQREREEALREFRRGAKPVLVATAVAARGLDIKGVEHVINYDLPKSIDEYVHRIGRTGRVGNKGESTSFFDGDHDTAVAGGIVTILTNAGQEVPEFMVNYAASGGGNAAFGGEDIRGGGAKTANAADSDEDWD